jgi:hypothetical protein
MPLRALQTGDNGQIDIAHEQDCSWDMERWHYCDLGGASFVEG